MSPDGVDPVLEAVAALRAAGVTIMPTSEEMDRWQIGDLIFSDADVIRLALRHTAAALGSMVSAKSEALRSSYGRPGSEAMRPEAGLPNMD